MGYIYKISNDINNKIYVGQTIKTINERWKTHIKAMKNPYSSKRDLYIEMKQYGLSHFSIESLEQVDNPFLNKREQYWIDYYDSCNKGYNNQKANDGYFYSWEEILGLWKSGMTYKEIEEETCISSSQLKRIVMKCATSQEKKIHKAKQINKTQGRAVIQIDKADNTIKTYVSIAEASRQTKIDRANIYRVLSGKGRTAGGYKWRYVDETNND